MNKHWTFVASHTCAFGTAADCLPTTEGQIVQVCDATGDDRNTTVWYKIIHIKKAGT